MFVRQNQQQFRNSNADVQIFYGSDITGSQGRTWNKPPGVSHVYMMFIGGGGVGDGTTGGGSGAVTVWYGAAQNVPDSLIIQAPRSGGTINSLTEYGGTTLISANRSTGTGGASTTAANAFASSGFYQSTAGQNGASGSISQSSTTFLSGGAVTGSTVTSNYGYRISSNGSGFFQLQPIIVGAGGSGNGNGGIGCGGGANNGTGTGWGGQGMVLIASW